MAKLVYKNIVKTAWKDFIKNENTLRDMVDRGDNYENVFTLLGKIFPIDGLMFECFKIENDRYELCFSADGNRSVLMLISFLIKFKPKETENLWSFSIGRAAAGNQDYVLKMGDVSVSPSEVDVYYAENEKKFAVFLYCKKLNKVMKKDFDAVVHVLSIMLTSSIGEVITSECINSFDVATKPKKKMSCVKLNMFSSVLNEHGIDKNYTLDIDNAENFSYTVYQAKPDVSENCKFREDVFVGTTALYELIDDYLSRKNSSVLSYMNNGVYAGFLGYNHIFLKKQDSEDNGVIFDYRESIYQKLLDACGPYVFTNIGGATGLYHSYIDLLIWDLPAFEEGAKKVFENEPPDHVLLREFVTTSKFIQIKNC